MAVEIKQVDQTKQLLPDALLREILKTGLVIVGGRGVGKSNAAKVITAEMIKRQPLPIQCKFFDTVLNWRWEFEPILFQEIDEKTRFVYSGIEHILYDIQLLETRDITFFIKKVIKNDFLKQMDLKKQLEGNLGEWELYMLEEASSSLDKYALRRKEGKIMLRVIAEGRNFNQCFIIIGQRLANISTSLVERCHGYLFGKMIGDNDLNKVRRICGSASGMREEVKNLADKGEFIYYNGSSAYKFNCPLYKVDTKPRKWIMKEEDKQIWIHQWGRRII